MENKAKRLKPVARLTRNQERDAAHAMGEARARVRKAEQKLLDLENYKKDYIQQFQARAKEGINGHYLQQYQRFLAQLELAVSQQKEVIKKAQRSLEATRDTWTKKNTRAEAIDKAVDKLTDEHKKAQDKKEQIQSDELASSRILRKESS